MSYSINTIWDEKTLNTITFIPSFENVDISLSPNKKDLNIVYNQEFLPSDIKVIGLYFDRDYTYEVASESENNFDE